MGDFYTHSDDGYSDPEVISVGYQVGRSAFYEVQLTLAEFASAQQSASGGVLGSPNLIQAQADIPGQGEGTCPQKDEYIWGKRPMKASTLVGKTGIPIYNPITRNFNELLEARLVADVDLCWMVTRHTKALVSTSHQYIQNPMDRIGKNLRNHQTGDVLSFDESQGHMNCFLDDFSLEPAGKGDVVQISLKTEFIYVCGHDRKKGIISHNRKAI